MVVYLSESIHPDSYALLAKEVEIVSNFNEPERIEGLITRNIQVDETLIAKLPNLKVIGIHGSGSDDVDIEEANRRHILVYNTPNLNSQSVAELIVAFMLSLSRFIIKADRDYAAQINTELAPMYLRGQEIQNKKVGIVGIGAIAQALIGILRDGFKMDILGYDPHLNIEKAKQMNIHHCPDLSTLLKESDYVCLCLPLNQETYHLFGKNEFELMKPTAFLINTARGAIVNDEALYLALKEKKIAGAASDVLENEPSFSKLMLLEQMIITPHLGANTEEALKRVGDECVKEMIKALNNETVKFEVKG